ncbi:hypothetical protein CUMW_119660, partial [Citrus unshiu]
MREEEKVKEKMNTQDYWLFKGIIVEVMSKAFADKGYCKQKGIVRKGSNARLLGVDTDKFCAKTKIEKGVNDGRVLNAIDYEDICKLA